MCGRRSDEDERRRPRALHSRRIVNVYRRLEFFPFYGSLSPLSKEKSAFRAVESAAKIGVKEVHIFRERRAEGECVPLLLLSSY